jgi:hypothetical protein
MAQIPPMAQKTPAIARCQAGNTAVKYQMLDILAAARTLLAEGMDPATPIQMLRANGSRSIKTTIGAAAGLAIAENEQHGPRFVRYRPRPDF